jgi:L-ascorbate metabolism protein UlaG (beta-lactamase superfamily)
MKLTWIGGPSFRLELGPFVVVGDPVLADRFDLDGAPVTRATPRADVDLSGADLVLVTSARADHWDPAGVARCGAAPVLAAGGVSGARVLARGEAASHRKGAANLTVTAVDASGDDNGYFLELAHGGRPFTAYVTGDVLFSEHTRELQRRHGYANLLVIHIGAERPGGVLRSADGKEAMQIVYRMQPNAIAAVHHTTFSHYTEPIGPFLEKIGLTIYEKRLRVLREGESFEKVIGPLEAA